MAAHSFPSQPRREITGLERYLARREALAFLDYAGLSRQEARDVEQELLARFLANEHSFDPSRGAPTAFFRVVIRTQALKMLRERSAYKRGRCLRVFCSDNFDELPADKDARLGVARRSATEAVELAEDIQVVVSQLPPNLRELAERLMKAPLMSVSRELGISHSTLGGWVRKIRQKFEQQSLQEYL